MNVDPGEGKLQENKLSGKPQMSPGGWEGGAKLIVPVDSSFHVFHDIQGNAKKTL